MSIAVQKVAYAIVQHDYALASLPRDTTINVISVHESLRRANRVMIQYIETLHPDLSKTLDNLDRDLSKEDELFDGKGNAGEGNWIRHDRGKLDFMRTDSTTLGEVTDRVSVRVFVMETVLWEGGIEYKIDAVKEDSDNADADMDTESDSYDRWVDKSHKCGAEDGNDEENPVEIGWDEEGLGKKRGTAIDKTDPKRDRTDEQGEITLVAPAVSKKAPETAPKAAPKMAPKKAPKKASKKAPKKGRK